MRWPNTGAFDNLANVLTVRRGEANPHKRGVETVTTKLSEPSIATVVTALGSILLWVNWSKTQALISSKSIFHNYVCTCPLVPIGKTPASSREVAFY
jgi:hypothetical protein